MNSRRAPGASWTGRWGRPGLSCARRPSACLGGGVICPVLSSGSHCLGAKAPRYGAATAAAGMGATRRRECRLTRAGVDRRAGQGTRGEVAAVRAGLRQRELRHRAGLGEPAAACAAVVIAWHRCLVVQGGRGDDAAIAGRCQSSRSGAGGIRRGTRTGPRPWLASGLFHPERNGPATGPGHRPAAPIAGRPVYPTARRRLRGCNAGTSASSGLASAASSASRNCCSLRSFSTFRPNTSFT